MVYTLGLYKNKRSHIIIEPMAQGLDSVRVSMGKAFMLKVPYDTSIIGQKTKEGF